MDNLNYGVIGNCCTAALILKKEVLNGYVFQILIHLLFLQLFWIVKKAGLLVLKFQEDYHTIQSYVPIPIFFSTTFCAQNKTNLR